MHDRLDDRSPRTIRRRRFLSTIVAALGAAACTVGTPRTELTTSPAVPTVPAQAVTDSEVAIGVVLSLPDGTRGRERSFALATKRRSDAVMQGGGIKVGTSRRSVRLVLADDQSEPSIAGRQAERLQSIERIGLLLGPFTTANTTAVTTVAERMGAIVVTQTPARAACIDGVSRVLSRSSHRKTACCTGWPTWQPPRVRARSQSGS